MSEDRVPRGFWTRIPEAEAAREHQGLDNNALINEWLNVLDSRAEFGILQEIDRRGLSATIDQYFRQYGEEDGYPPSKWSALDRRNHLRVELWSREQAARPQMTTLWPEAARPTERREIGQEARGAAPPSPADIWWWRVGQEARGAAPPSPADIWWWRVGQEAREAAPPSPDDIFDRLAASHDREVDDAISDWEARTEDLGEPVNSPKALQAYSNDILLEVPSVSGINGDPNWAVERHGELVASGMDDDQAWNMVDRERVEALPPLDRQMEGFVQAMTEGDLARAAVVGVRGDDLSIHQMVGVAQGRMLGNGRWEPVESGGERLFVTPVRVDEMTASGSLLGSDPWTASRYGKAVDLVAWDPGDSSRYALLTGAGLALGAPGAAPSPSVVKSLKLEPTPLDWLRSDGQAVAVLTQDPGERQKILDSLKPEARQETLRLEEKDEDRNVPAMRMRL